MTNPSFDTPKREVLVFYYKYRRRLLLAFFLPLLASIAISFVPTPQYQATGTLVVRLGEEYVYQPEVGATMAGQANPIPFERDQIYKAEVAILGSHDLHQQVIEGIGLDRMYPAHKSGLVQRVTEPLRDALVTPLDYFLTPKAEDGFAPRIAASLRDMLVGDEALTKASPADQARHRLDMAIEKFDKQLKIDLQKESAVIDLTFSHPDRDVAVAVLQKLFSQYMEKRKEIYLENRSNLAKDQAEKIRKRVTGLRGEIESFKREHKIYSLPEQRMQLLQQREDIRKQMTIVSSTALEDRLNNITAQLDALDALERQSNALDHDLQVASDEYTIYAHKLDEAQSFDTIAHARAGSVRIIQEPSASPHPKKLQGLIVAIGFILSMIIAFIVAAVTEYTRSGFLTPERLERNLGLPILAVLPLRKE